MEYVISIKKLECGRIHWEIRHADENKTIVCGRGSNEIRCKDMIMIAIMHIIFGLRTR